MIGGIRYIEVVKHSVHVLHPVLCTWSSDGLVSVAAFWTLRVLEYSGPENYWASFYYVIKGIAFMFIFLPTSVDVSVLFPVNTHDTLDGFPLFPSSGCTRS